MSEEIAVNCKYGYVRVSSKSQESNSSLASQKEKLIEQGILEKLGRLQIQSKIVQSFLIL